MKSGNRCRGPGQDVSLQKLPVTLSQCSLEDGTNFHGGDAWQHSQSTASQRNLLAACCPEILLGLGHMDTHTADLNLHWAPLEVKLIPGGASFPNHESHCNTDWHGPMFPSQQKDSDQAGSSKGTEVGFQDLKAKPNLSSETLIFYCTPANSEIPTVFPSEEVWQKTSLTGPGVSLHWDLVGLNPGYTLGS